MIVDNKYTLHMSFLSCLIIDNNKCTFQMSSLSCLITDNNKCTFHMSSLSWHEYWQVYTWYFTFVMAWLLTTSVHFICHLCHGLIIWNPTAQEGVETVTCDLYPPPPPGECQYPHSNHLHNYSGEMDCNDLSPLPPATDRHTHTVMGGEIFSPPPPPPFMFSPFCLRGLELCQMTTHTATIFKITAAKMDCKNMGAKIKWIVIIWRVASSSSSVRSLLTQRPSLKLQWLKNGL